MEKVSERSETNLSISSEGECDAKTQSVAE